MKIVMVLALASFVNMGFAFENSGDPCKCQSGTCPGYTVAKCGFKKDRDASNGKVVRTPSQSNKGVKANSGRGQ